MFLLDTNVVSELRKIRSGKTDFNVAQWAIAADAGLLFLSAIVIQELETGALLLERRDARREHLCADGWKTMCCAPLKSVSCRSIRRHRRSARVGVELCELIEVEAASLGRLIRCYRTSNHTVG